MGGCPDTRANGADPVGVEPLIHYGGFEVSVRMGHRQKPTRGQLSTILVRKPVENTAPSFKAP